MLGDSAVLGAGGGSGGGEGGASADAVAGVSHDGAVAASGGGGGVGSNSGDDERGRIEEGERSFGGNRWPRQETLALLRIRSDMDVAFRDASVKGPLWEEVSRKMAELGYHRSSKKCKEKFENVYKYHKRTKEGRSGKQDGKTYRFFDQLQALENHTPTPHSPKPSPKLPQSAPSRVIPATAASLSLPIATASTTASSLSLPIPTTILTTVPMQPILSNTTLTSTVPHITVPSTTTLPITIPQPMLTTPSIHLSTPSYPPTNPTTNTAPPPSFPTLPTDTFSNSSSSSTSSDETLEGRRKRKRKWKDFFERLMKEVIQKQEDLQKKFLEAIEKREHERIAREEAWRVQEMQRIDREREILAQERSIAAAKDAAVMSFLQKVAEQQNLGQALNSINLVQQPPTQQPQPPLQQLPPSSVAPSALQQPLPAVVSQPLVFPVVSHVTNMEIVKVDNNNNNSSENFRPSSSSRWPKVEVQALIKLRTNLDAKYQENGPKGPLWEEISSSMRKLGYNRNAKRCKEKWENINKYFKKVKESNKRRPEDSKTCPYFHQLDALYREKSKVEGVAAVKPESTVAPLMVRPEQQWPPQEETMRDRDIRMEDVENEDDEYEEEREGEGEGEEEEDDEEDEEGGGDGKYEIVANKTSGGSVAASTE
ncbi:trihelix transcription factor DF1-like [Vigna umbellata]|uniref:trihelix transcription factor DF1-like n=1 Tax=Vigna umbellata TaxID=87088 RepID=UPI001F5F2FAD|nr:trihelix transcription factor DF1-like [Vigna umbellata]